MCENVLLCEVCWTQISFMGNLSCGEDFGFRYVSGPWRTNQRADDLPAGYVFETLFELDTDSTTALYLVDVKASNNSSVLTRLSTESIKSLDQLPSAAIYDSEQHRLYFHNSGIYTLLIRLYYDHRPGILFECQIPVEAR